MVNCVWFELRLIQVWKTSKFVQKIVHPHKTMHWIYKWGQCSKIMNNFFVRETISVGLLIFSSGLHRCQICVGIGVSHVPKCIRGVDCMVGAPLHLCMWSPSVAALSVRSGAQVSAIVDQSPRAPRAPRRNSALRPLPAKLSAHRGRHAVLNQHPTSNKTYPTRNTHEKQISCDVFEHLMRPQRIMEPLSHLNDGRGAMMSCLQSFPATCCQDYNIWWAFRKCPALKC